ncbi:uncharacterized protein LOC132196406 isoform X2 [Neocloeon triangulifer]|uniref:uncharacterized protein LOC132196406 isoform X2 n=1 Tax=Neocloeon triangulifer TaxID=2078957 RepID=UPI00286EE0E1|nr:uncharacterized protein LOC132196406 isoform X2 [Neocloeon triangulifer]
MSKFTRSGVMMVYSNDDAEVGGEESLFQDTTTISPSTSSSEGNKIKPSGSIIAPQQGSKIAEVKAQNKTVLPTATKSKSSNKKLHVCASDLPENYFDDLLDIMSLPPKKKQKMVVELGDDEPPSVQIKLEKIENSSISSLENGCDPNVTSAQNVSVSKKIKITLKKKPQSDLIPTWNENSTEDENSQTAGSDHQPDQVEANKISGAIDAATKENKLPAANTTRQSPEMSGKETATPISQSNEMAILEKEKFSTIPSPPKKVGSVQREISKEEENKLSSVANKSPSETKIPSPCDSGSKKATFKGQPLYKSPPKGRNKNALMPDVRQDHPPGKSLLPTPFPTSPRPSYPTQNFHQPMYPGNMHGNFYHGQGYPYQPYPYYGPAGNMENPYYPGEYRYNQLAQQPTGMNYINFNSLKQMPIDEMKQLPGKPQSSNNAVSAGVNPAAQPNNLVKGGKVQESSNLVNVLLKQQKNNQMGKTNQTLQAKVSPIIKKPGTLTDGSKGKSPPIHTRKDFGLVETNAAQVKANKVQRTGIIINSKAKDTSKIKESAKPINNSSACKYCGTPKEDLRCATVKKVLSTEKQTSTEAIKSQLKETSCMTDSPPVVPVKSFSTIGTQTEKPKNRDMFTMTIAKKIGSTTVETQTDFKIEKAILSNVPNKPVKPLPTKSAPQPMKNVSRPAKIAPQATKSAIKPTKSSPLPSKSASQPSESVPKATKNAPQPTQSTPQPTKKKTQKNKANKVEETRVDDSDCTNTIETSVAITTKEPVGAETKSSKVTKPKPQSNLKQSSAFKKQPSLYSSIVKKNVNLLRRGKPVYCPNVRGTRFAFQRPTRFQGPPVQNGPPWNQDYQGPRRPKVFQERDDWRGGPPQFNNSERPHHFDGPPEVDDADWNEGPPGPPIQRGPFGPQRPSNFQGPQSNEEFQNPDGWGGGPPQFENPEGWEDERPHYCDGPPEFEEVKNWNAVPMRPHRDDAPPGQLMQRGPFGPQKLPHFQGPPIHEEFQEPEGWGGGPPQFENPEGWEEEGPHHFDGPPEFEGKNWNESPVRPHQDGGPPGPPIQRGPFCRQRPPHFQGPPIFEEHREPPRFEDRMGPPGPPRPPWDNRPPGPRGPPPLRGHPLCIRGQGRGLRGRGLQVRGRGLRGRGIRGRP